MDWREKWHRGTRKAETNKKPPTYADHTIAGKYLYVQSYAQSYLYIYVPHSSYKHYNSSLTPFNVTVILDIGQ
jgi:hypothetical protein